LTTGAPTPTESARAGAGKRALVTGGSGYFGCVVVAALRARGYEVCVFDLVDVEDRPSDVRFFRGDIRDAEAIARACEGVDVVHHNVAQVPIAKDRELFESVNVGGTRNLLEAAQRHRVGKTVLVSSSAVFGVPSKNPVDASVAPRPREAYGVAKLEAERIAHTFVERGLDVTIVRPRTILGHGRLGIFQILFEWVRKGRPVYVLGRGDNRYQFVHADDLADACIRAGERPGPATFNVGAERFGTMRGALEALVRHAKTGSRVRSLPMRPAERLMELTSQLGLSPLGPYHSLMYGREMFFDVTPVKEALGWSATRSNDEMLIESYDYYVTHRDEVLARRGASHHRSPIRQGILRLLEYVP
jgi:nucleoside-diphosphate-sugar epimerase